MTKRIMRKLKIAEISGVDIPAQSGAKAVIQKNFVTDPYQDINKSMSLLSEVEGHSHLLDDTYPGNVQGGCTSYEMAEGEDVGHSHPWVRNMDGSITIGASDGHTHTLMSKKLSKTEFSAEQRQKLADSGQAMKDGAYPVRNKKDLKDAIASFGRADNKAAVASHIKARATALKATDMLPMDGELADLMKSAGIPGKEQTMADNDNKAAEQRVTVLESELAVSKAFGGLNDAEKAHYHTLSEGDRKTFLAKSSGDRQVELTRLTEANPVVYKAADGTEFHKNDDPRLIAMAKRADTSVAQATEAIAKAETARLEKRAGDELQHLPGEAVEKVALLRAVEGISDEPTRTKVTALLKANNEAMAKAFERVGTSKPGANGDAQTQLDALAKKYAEDNKVSVPEAFSKVLATPEGDRLYALTIKR